MESVIPSYLAICRRNAAEAKARQPIADPSPDHYRDPTVEHLRTALIFVDCKPECFRSDFKEWLTENFHVYVEFDQRASKLWSAGRTHFGARSIWETMRYDSAIGELNSEWKLNDHFPPCCARLWMMLHPQAADFFETRSGVSAQRAI